MNEAYVKALVEVHELIKRYQRQASREANVWLTSLNNVVSSKLKEALKDERIRTGIQEGLHASN